MEENNNKSDNVNKESLEDSFEKLIDAGAGFIQQAAIVAGKGLENSSQLITKGASKTIDSFSVFANKFLEEYIHFMDKAEKIVTSKTIDFLSYRELLDYVIKNKPNLEEFRRAAIVKRIIGNYEDKKIKLTIAYLDNNDRPIWKDSNGNELCVVIIANKIDDEIKEVFGNKDTIFME